MTNYMAAVNEKAFGEAFLDDILNWISSDMDPDEVFEKSDLCDWIGGNMEPDEVYDHDILAEWAETNGFIEVE